MNRALLHSAATATCDLRQKTTARRVWPPPARAKGAVGFDVMLGGYLFGNAVFCS